MAKISKMPRDMFSEIFEIDGVCLNINSGHMEKQKIQCITRREKELWEISLTSEEGIMLLIPFNEPLKEIIEEILRVTKKEKKDDSKN